MKRGRLAEAQAACPVWLMAGEMIRRLEGAGAVHAGAAVAAEPWRGGLLAAPTVTEASVGRANNFTILRLLLAFAVVVSHGFSVTTGNVSDEPLTAATGYTMGEHAVNGFFVISGFLVTMSFDRRGWLDYLLARVLRIAPGLIAATLMVGVVMGAMLSSLGPFAYLADAGTWKFVFQTLVTYKSNTVLPGVFSDNPFRFPMGTVWTLKYEVLCYAGVFVIGVVGLLRSRRLALALMLGLTAAVLLLDWLQPDAGKGLQTALRLPLLFTAGAVFYRLGGAIRLSALAGMFMIAGVILLRHTFAYNASLFITTAYVLMWLALVPVSRRVPEPRTDVSYGAYLYGWPVQQALHALFPALGAWALLAPSLVITGLVALASWRFVEKPALDLKRRLLDPRDARRTGPGPEEAGGPVTAQT